MITLEQLQKEIEIWSNHNFPDSTWIEPFMGSVEEIGELSHALLKQRQGIRGTYEEHENTAKDSVADEVIFLIHLCIKRGWNFSDIVEETWNKVKQRDWKKNNKTGV